MDAFLNKLSERSVEVVVVGQRYAGLQVAMHAAEVSFDVSTDLVAALARGESFVGDVL